MKWNLLFLFTIEYSINSFSQNKLNVSMALMEEYYVLDAKIQFTNNSDSSIWFYTICNRVSKLDSSNYVLEAFFQRQFNAPVSLNNEVICDFSFGEYLSSIPYFPIDSIEIFPSRTISVYQRFYVGRRTEKRGRNFNVLVRGCLFKRNEFKRYYESITQYYDVITKDDFVILPERKYFVKYKIRCRYKNKFFKVKTKSVSN